MPVGFQCFRPDGSLVFDANDSLTRVIGTFWTSGASGSVFVPEWAAGQRAWFTAVRENGLSYMMTIPSVYITGSTVAWTITAGSTIAAIDRFYVTYGVY